MNIVRRLVHFGAHAVDVGRLYATQRILGVVTVLWSLFAGMFLFLGGARQMRGTAWQPLLDIASKATLRTVPPDKCYLLIGAILFVGGVAGFVGLVLTARTMSLISAIIGAVWCLAVTGFLGFSNVAVAEGGNFLAVSVFLNFWLFLMRYFLLVLVPDPDRAVQLYERG